jgi:two-component system nitrogen regulation response regulator GlnG
LVTEFACYNWPGNIRQLNHALKRVILWLQTGDIPKLANILKTPMKPQASAVVRKTPDETNIEALQTLRKKVNELSETDVLSALENNGWYIQAAAQALGISRPSMYKLIASHTQIRRIDQISEEEIRRALISSADDLVACASLLKTPSEALRRHLRGAVITS